MHSVFKTNPDTYNLVSLFPHSRNICSLVVLGTLVMLSDMWKWYRESYKEMYVRRYM